MHVTTLKRICIVISYLKTDPSCRHVSMSVGIASNVPGFEEGKCFITSGNEKELIQNLIDLFELFGPGRPITRRRE